MKHMRAALAVAALAVAAPPAAAYADSNNAAVVDTVPYVQVIQHPCTGEFVILSGEVHGVHRLAFDETGVFVHRVEVNVLHVEGVGTTTGTRYRLTWPTLMTNNSVGASEGSAVAQFLLIAPGPANDVRDFLVGHFTFDANGNQTAAVFHVDSATCTGG